MAATATKAKGKNAEKAAKDELVVEAEPIDPQEEIAQRDLSGTMGEPLPFHTLADLFPPMTAEEYRSLKLDIAENGQLMDIYTADGQIIDGRHRYRALRELGITPRTVEWDGRGSLTAFAVGLNLNRRHLTTSQRAAIALSVLPSFEEEAAARMKAGTTDPTANLQEGTRADNTAAAQAGRVMNVSPKTVANAKKLQTEAPDLMAAVVSGEMTINKALTIAGERPNADGTVKPSRQSSKPPAEDRTEGALFELYDTIEMWIAEYGRIPSLKEVTVKAKGWVSELKAFEAAGVDADVDTSVSYVPDVDNSGDTGTPDEDDI